MLNVTHRLNELRKKSTLDLAIEGPSSIGGEVAVQGSKNTANKLLATPVALPGIYEIGNLPIILDMLEMLSIIEYLDGTIDLDVVNSRAFIDTRAITSKPLPYSLTKSTTGAFGYAGALLGRFGTIKIGKPGGDQIGPRPVDLHVDAFKALGASVEDSVKKIEAELKNVPNEADFTLRMPSTGASINYLLALAAKRGIGRLQNAPVDGDMSAMYELMRALGVSVTPIKNGVEVDATAFKPSDKIMIFRCPPDKNDAFTWLAFGALSRDGLRVNNLNLNDAESGLKVLSQLGVEVKHLDKTSVLVNAPVNKRRQNVTVVAGLSKTFHSDWAPMLEPVLATLDGNFRIIDTLFSNRIRQAELLQAMGADVLIGGGMPPDGVDLHFSANPMQARYIIDIQGPAQLKPIKSTVGYDVRACASLVIAASQASGESVLSDMKALYRGYEKIVERLKSIGLNVSIME